MKILTAQQIREADAYTIRHEPVSDIDLMERAAGRCFAWLDKRISREQAVHVFAGSGNNGGDGLAIARMMSAAGFQVTVVLAGDPDALSPSCRTNLERWNNLAGAEVIPPDRWVPETGAVLIDALLGTGLSRPAGEALADVIGRINQSGLTVISIDIPSGLYCDRASEDRTPQAVVEADFTLTFAPPKMAFMIPGNSRFTGEMVLLDIGISEEFLREADTKNYYTTADDLAAILKKRTAFQHKGHFGHALLVAGSKGKMGAAILAARGCLRAGTGLTTVGVPRDGLPVIQTAVPEAMAIPDPQPDLISRVPDIKPFTAVGIGPGLGTAEPTQQALKHLIQSASGPLIFDADAINILGLNKTWLSFIPKGSVFTPHPKEFERLAGSSGNHFERLGLQREFSFKYQCFVVLKGARTSVTNPEGDCFFNSTGNPGMATGGSGDVLTGILTGLAAQGYPMLTACIAGVFLHGLAGDLASAETGQEALIAGDLVRYLGKAFQTVYGEL